MKVLLVNGSPNEKGCTYTALMEVADTLEKEGIEKDIFWIGNKPLSGCIDCKTCMKKKKCVFDDRVNEFLEIAASVDGFILVHQCILGPREVQLLPLWTAHFLQTWLLIDSLFT